MKKLKIKKKHHRDIKQIIQYSITGGAWFWGGYAMFALCYSVWGLDIIPAKIISYVFGLTINFILERFWVFDSRDARKNLDKVTFRYILLSVVNLAIDTGIVWGLSRVGVTPYIGQFVSAGFFTIWNFVWYRLWVFAVKKPLRPRRAASPALKRPKVVKRKRAVMGATKNVKRKH